jgi:pyranose oxidase
VLLKTLVDAIPDTPEFRDAVAEHRSKHRDDPLPIPFEDLEPQVIIPYKPTTPWFAQIHRDAFSYGDVGPKADPRVVVDLRLEKEKLSRRTE